MNYLVLLDHHSKIYVSCWNSLSCSIDLLNFWQFFIFLSFPFIIILCSWLKSFFDKIFWLQSFANDFKIYQAIVLCHPHQSSIISSLSWKHFLIMFHLIVHNMFGILKNALEKELFLIVTEPMKNLEIFWLAQIYHYREYLVIS